MSDPFDLARFLDAQRDTHAVAIAELRHGRKQSHWMWFTFPQVAGLGTSPMARCYAIRSLDEAVAYLHHPVLAARLEELATALQELPDPDPAAVFGGIDAVKLRSSLTLFIAAGGPPVLAAVLDRWFAGREDPATLRILGNRSAV